MANWDKLIEKYLAGETNLLEEKALRNYLFSEQVDEKHIPIAALFIKPEQNLLGEMKGDPFAKIQFENKKTTKLKSILSIAASLFLLIFAGLSIMNTMNVRENDAVLKNYEPQSEEEAYEQTLIALEMLSKKFNGGKTSVEQGIESFKKASEIINK